VIRIEMRKPVQSANAFINRQGHGGSHAYRKDRDEWAMLIRAALRPRLQPPKFKVTCELHSYRSRELDHANLVGGAKGLIDCLVRQGHLYDDRPAYFDCTYHQHKTKRVDERTVLVIHSA
jgi:hypothetical protein